MNVSFCTHLINIVAVDDVVEVRVQVVQKVHDFDGRAVGADGREAHDVGEVDRHLVERLWLHRLSDLQLVRYHSASDEKLVI